MPCSFYLYLLHLEVQERSGTWFMQEQTCKIILKKHQYYHETWFTFFF